MVAHRLPSQPTPFVGRSEELAEIDRLLSDPTCRLLTLVGPGGIGKTRLALAVAENMLANHNHSPSLSNGEGARGWGDDVFFVPLQAVSAPEVMVATVAESIGMQFYSGTNRESQLLNYLQNKSLLLVMDNFEHLLDGAGLVSEMLAAAPGLKVLATSRERLNLQEEWVYEVRGLRYPTNGDVADNYSAVQLFVQSARRVNPSFSLEAERAAVARICRLVEGMPLAIELASSWGRAMAYGELADEIAHGLDILETQARNVPPRHRSMRAVLDFSWQYLTDEERETIAWLSVFRGGFTREAACAVAACPDSRRLVKLVDKSWLRHDSASGRYSVHELVRQYAGDRLEEFGQANDARASHCAYYSDFMRQRETDIKYRRQIDGLADIERDFENVRLAWRWAAEGRDCASIRQMMEALNFYCDMRARFAEGEELFRTAAEHFAQGQSCEERLIHAALIARRVRQIVLGSLTQFGSVVDFIPAIEASTAVARECDDLPELGFQLLMMGMVQFAMAQAMRYYEESLDIFNRLEDPFYMAEMLTWIGICHHEPEKSKALHHQAADLEREIGDLNGLSWSLQHLSRIAFWEHQYDESERYSQEALAIQRQRGDLKGLHYSMIMGCQRKFRRGEFAEARAMAQEAYQIAQNLNLAALKQAALSTLGLVAVLTDEDYETAERLSTEVLAMNLPPHYSVGDSISDAVATGVMAAYHRGDVETARRLYNHLVALLDEMDLSWYGYRFAVQAFPAVFILAGEGQHERAVELLAQMLELPDLPNYPDMRWLAKTPPLGRLMDDLRARLGDAAYDAAWERGKRFDMAVTARMLSGDLREPIRSSSQSADTLTEREVEILRLAAEGLSNSQIAERLTLSRGTVKWYLSQIYGKLGVVNRAQAIARAHDLAIM